jgi:hypothetical protein
MYGGVEENGVVSNELWAFDVSAKTWENITVRTEQCNTTGLNATILCGEYFQHVCELNFHPYLTYFKFISHKNVNSDFQFSLSGA